MPTFFIHRPVFAWVIAILISLGGVLALLKLGVESYPSIAPPQVTVNATYPGADAATTEQTVTQVIEQQLSGIDNLLYFSSSSSANGASTITLTFQTGTNPDIAQVQVQNKVALATPRLPTQVTQQGVVVAKTSPSFLMVVALQSDDPAIDSGKLDDIVASQVLDQVARLPGIGSTELFGSEYAMRIWLDPQKLQGYGLSATQVMNALQTQNMQFAAGSLGSDPAPGDQAFSATVSAEGRFTTPEQFAGIILRANTNGTDVKLGDVARIGFGPSSYGFSVRYNNKPIAGFALLLQPGANALDVAAAVRDKMNELAPSFPAGVSWFVPYDTTTFVKVSIEEVIHTLLEAIALVFLVMLLFLQNFRATLIPTLVIPVALLGTLLGMLPLGFTINQLTMFGMVLAIGIVVDDAIVVIENVERIMAEEHLPAKEATIKAMGQISGAVVAITVVLAAVFIPSAVQPGATGVIYRQFALTIAVSMAFSAFLALSFTPALCASFLTVEHHAARNVIFRAFNRCFSAMTHAYTGHVGRAVRHAPRWMLSFVLLTLLTGLLFHRLPGSFLPEEDQGYALAIVQLPPGATIRRTDEVMAQIHARLRDEQALEGIVAVSGYSFMGSGENVGMVFFRLKDWDKRDATIDDFIARTNIKLHAIHDAMIFVVNLPTINGLGQFGGFDMFLQDRAGLGRAALLQARNQLLGQAVQDPSLLGVRPNTLESAPLLALHADRVQAQSMGLSLGDVYNAISLMLAPVYANDFNYGGRVKRVIVQADAAYRNSPEALNRFFTPSYTQTHANGMPAMIPLSSVVKADWSTAEPVLTRYNGYSAVEIVGAPAPGHASGTAMKSVDRIVTDHLPHGYGVDWTGQSYQEILSGNTATRLMVLSVLIVFLCLAALYESWSIPVAVLLVVPLGILGAVVLTMLRGMPNDIYFKIGLITVIGLAAKNAILIVEFAVAQQRRGMSLFEGVLQAARLRLRPILMTSLAFILGVCPLFVSSGAGANARHAVSTGVIGGMLFATTLGILLIPVFYVVVRRLLGDPLHHDKEDKAQMDGLMQPFDSDPRRGH